MMDGSGYDFSDIYFNFQCTGVKGKKYTIASLEKANYFQGTTFNGMASVDGHADEYSAYLEFGSRME